MIPNESCNLQPQYSAKMEAEPSDGKQEGHLSVGGMSGGCVSPSSTHSSMEPSRLDRGTSNEEEDDENNEEYGGSSSPGSDETQSAVGYLTMADKASGLGVSKRRSLLALSPLAVACRSSTPSVKTVRAILGVYPSQVRSCRNASVGTPLHEAASNSAAGYGVIDVLLTADEDLDQDVSSRVWQDGTSPPSSVRAALMQDADGSVPLHLLVRRAFLCCSYPSSLPGVGAFRATAASMTAGRKRQRPRTSAADQSIPDDSNVGDEEEEILAMVRRMVQSCPSSVGVADHREFEETPLVTALKGSTLYNGSMTPPRPPSPMPSLNHPRNPDTSQILSFQNVLTIPNAPGSVVLDGEHTGTSDCFAGTVTSFVQHDPRRVQAVPQYADSRTMRIEHLTYQIVRIMLAAFPEAALADLLSTSFPKSSSASGDDRQLDAPRRGEPFAPYTPLHSAVFHGRCVETVRLLVEADMRACQVSASGPVGAYPPTSVSALRPNGFGELALHVAAMRAESARLIRLLADAEPRSVFARDRKNALTPLHWLWMRFVDRLTERLNGHRAGVNDVVAFSLEQNGTSVDDEQCKRTDGRKEMHADVSRSTWDVPCNSPPVSMGVFGGGCKPHDSVEKEALPKGDPTLMDVDKKVTSWSERYGESILASASLFLPPSFFCIRSFVDPILPTCEGEDVELDNFDAEYNHASRQWIDRPLTFERMRHVSSGYHENEGRCAQHIFKVLSAQISEGARPRSCSDTKPATVESVRGLKRRRESIGKTTSDDMDTTCLELETTSRPAAEVVVIAHFWAKFVAILRAFARTQPFLGMPQGLKNDVEAKLPAKESTKDASNGSNDNVGFLVHAACGASVCPPSLARVCMSLYPQELQMADANGMLPLHHAARRDWHPRDLLRPLPTTSRRRRRTAADHKPPHLLFGESLTAFRHVMAASPSGAASRRDKEGRLPLHHAIDSAMSVLMLLCPGMRQQCQDHDPTNGRNIRFFFQNKNNDDATAGPWVVDASLVLRFIKSAMVAFPEALARRDGRTQLFPFLQAAAAAAPTATTTTRPEIPGCDCLQDQGKTKTFLQTTILGADETATSVVYLLLREHPMLVQQGLPPFAGRTNSGT